MNAELQLRCWQCLPKAARELLRYQYRAPMDGNWANGYKTALGDTFGRHNLTSDTEPEELLYCNKAKVQQAYKMGMWGNSGSSMLKYLFGDKCLPDKEPMKIDAADSLIIMAKDEMDITEKPIKVGDKVRVVKLYHDGSGHEYMAMTGEVIKVGEKRCRIFNGLIEVSLPYYMLEVIEPYTEENETKRKETQNLSLSDKQPTERKETMEEKELNLAELLKGCEGEEFFSISVGKVTFKAIYDYDDTHKVRTIRKDAVGNEYNINFHSDGRRNKAGLQDLYPSEDLLIKYPLDAKKAWDEWASERKPKRWRAKRGDRYWWFNDELEVKCNADIQDIIDNNRYNLGNYFRTEKLAQQAAEAVRETLMKIHEQNAI